MIKALWSYLSKGSSRTVKAKKNVLGLLILKGLSILIDILLVPLTIGYVNEATYGIWLTLSTMVGWMSFFDIGINNGLKNRLAEAIAKQDYDLGKKYVSTTYSILSMIFIPIAIVAPILSFFVNWNTLLNLEKSDVEGLQIVIIIIIVYFCLNFILSTINRVLAADMRTADSAARSLIGKLAILSIIFILTKTTQGNLINLCLALTIAPLVILILFNFTLFKGRYKAISPSIKSVDMSLAKDLMKLGVQFFVIQIAAVIQYQLTNFIIIRYFGPADVTAVNIAHKYFAVGYMVWGILLSPMWPATTDAVTRGDISWVRNSVKKFLKIYTGFTGVFILMLLASQSIYHLWVGDKVNISFEISLWTMIFDLVFMFGNIFVTVLNGAGILRVQSIASLISPIVFLLTCFISIKAGIGVFCVLMASTIANFNGFILAPIQFYRHFSTPKSSYK